MRLTAYATSERRLTIEPAPARREWMDRTAQRFAYRCLPLTIANAHGWQILNPVAFRARWNGGAGVKDLTVRRQRGAEGTLVARSHFGHGILTFSTGYVFRTDPGWVLYVMPPPNRPKDGLQGLSGIVETDWSPYGFTMNWQLTRPDHSVAFGAGEPFCFLFPVPRSAIELVEPQIRPIADDPELEAAYALWSAERARFIAELARARHTTHRDLWQKHYHRGLMPDGRPAPAPHTTRIDAKPFRES